MQIIIEIPDDAADTCADIDGKSDPVEFLTTQLQEIANVNVAMAVRRKADRDLLAAGVDEPHLLSNATAYSLRVLLLNTQPALMDQVMKKQAEIDAMTAAAKK